MTENRNPKALQQPPFLATETDESQLKYEFLLELCHDGILIVQDGKIRESNHLMARMCGYTVEEVLDTELASFLHPEDMQWMERIYARVIDDANAIEIHETAFMCKNGIKIFAEVTAGQFVYNQQPAVLLMIREINDQEQACDIQKKNDATGPMAALSGGVAHDCNHLLSAIIGNISKARANLPPEHKAFMMLSEALMATNTAQNLTHQLIQFSNDSNPQKTAASVADLLTSATEFTLSGSNVRPVYQWPPGLWPIDVEKSQIVQAIHNIVMNAREAMPHGGEIKISAENITLQNAEAHLSEGRYVKMVFKDHGCGIRKIFLDKIFDPYFSTKNHTIQHASGLGLPISQTIISKHGGAIKVESIVGMGTSLFVYLPAGDAPTVEKETPITAETEIPIFGNGRILIVDDEKTIRELGGKIVTHLGYEVEFACNGSEAVDQYKKALDARLPYEAVILDLMVSGAMDGIETVEKLLKLDPQVNAIVSSGYASQPDITDFERHGFKGFVARPYTEEELRVTLDRVLPAVH